MGTVRPVADGQKKTRKQYRVFYCERQEALFLTASCKHA